LRLVSPDALDTAAATAGLVTAPGPAAGPAAPTSAAAIAPTPGSGGPAGLFVTTNAGMVGHPSMLDDAVAVVGPVTPGGMTALSSSAAGIPQGLASAFGAGS